MGEEPTAEQLAAASAARRSRATFAPVFMGVGVQEQGRAAAARRRAWLPPRPTKSENVPLDLSNNEEPGDARRSTRAPLVGLAFKLEEGRFGQLTYLRIYQGTIANAATRSSTRARARSCKVPALVRMHSDEMEDVESRRGRDLSPCSASTAPRATRSRDGVERRDDVDVRARAGDVARGRAEDRRRSANFSKALSRFKREDPTFRVHIDPESGRRSSRAWASCTSRFTSSACARVRLRVHDGRAPRGLSASASAARGLLLPAQEAERRQRAVRPRRGVRRAARGRGSSDVVFENGIIGNAIAPAYILACDQRVQGGCADRAAHRPPGRGRARRVDGRRGHAVDSSEMAFKLGGAAAFRQVYERAAPKILEPIMHVEITVPDRVPGHASSGTVIAAKGTIKTHVGGRRRRSSRPTCR